MRRLDLQDLASVREFAAGVDKVDVLVNNAGIMAVPYALTVDGFESQIGTNHLGHFALTNLLLRKITERVVTVSSMMHLMGYISLKDLNWKSRPYPAWPAYGQSKLANLLFTSELQRRLDAAGSPVKAHAAHPGYSATNLQSHSAGTFGRFFEAGNELLATDADFGARQTLYALSQDLPGNSFIGPRFGMRGPTRRVGRSPLARNANTAPGCGSYQRSSRTPNFRSEEFIGYPCCPDALTCAGVTARVVRATVIDGNLVSCDPGRAPRTTTGIQEQHYGQDRPPPPTT